MVGGDAFGNGGHPDRVGPSVRIHADLCRSLVGRSEKPRVDAGMEFDADFLRAGFENVDAGLVVGLGEIRKARAELGEVRPFERIVAHEIEMILDDHEIARAKARIHAAGGVRENQVSEFPGHKRCEWGKPRLPSDSLRKHGSGLPRKTVGTPWIFADDHAARMSFDGSSVKIRNVRVGDDDRVGRRVDD